MTSLLENPIPILVTGIFAAAVCGVAWVMTSKRSALAALGGVALLTAGLLLLERAIVTNVEQVEATLHRMARAVEQGDVPTLLAHVSASLPEVRRQLEARIDEVDVEQVDIKPNLEIKVFPERTPPRATATFNVVVRGSMRNLGGTQSYPRYFECHFIKRDDRWQLIAYEDFDPIRRR